MAEEIKMAENVMLVDASFLNLVTKDIKSHFERVLGRELPDADLANLFVYLAYDAGIPKGSGLMQVLLIYDRECTSFACCRPSGLETELNNVGFKDELGEFVFHTFQPEQLATLEDLYVESLKIVAAAKEVRKLVVISFNEQYGERVGKILRETDGKEIIQFRMDEPEKELPWRWEILAYPVMQAFGIRGDEL